MNIKKFGIGIYNTNCYLVWNEKNEATLFDCGGSNIEDVVTFLKEKNLDLKNLILTHGHADHMGGINELKNEFKNLEIYIGEEDSKFLVDPYFNLSETIYEKKIVYDGIFKTLKGGDRIFDFEVIDTQGHTQGSKCFYNRKLKYMLTGDTLFREGYGRCDLPTGDISKLKESLKYLFDNFPKDTIVYSGHGEETSLGRESDRLKKY